MFQVFFVHVHVSSHDHSFGLYHTLEWVITILGYQLLLLISIKKIHDQVPIFLASTWKISVCFFFKNEKQFSSWLILNLLKTF